MGSETQAMIQILSQRSRRESASLRAEEELLLFESVSEAVVVIQSNFSLSEVAFE